MLMLQHVNSPHVLGLTFSTQFSFEEPVLPSIHCSLSVVCEATVLKYEHYLNLATSLENLPFSVLKTVKIGTQSKQNVPYRLYQCAGYYNSDGWIPCNNTPLKPTCGWTFDTGNVLRNALTSCFLLFVVTSKVWAYKQNADIKLGLPSRAAGLANLPKPPFSPTCSGGFFHQQSQLIQVQRHG